VISLATQNSEESNVNWSVMVMKKEGRSGSVRTTMDPDPGGEKVKDLS
jgi:hypothetical protein